MVDFHIVGTPLPGSVRDASGRVVDGYSITVQSNTTGATALLQIPQALYTIEGVQQAAEQALSVSDALIEKFAKPRAAE